LALKRELAAAVAIPIVLAVLFWAPPIAFNLLVAAVGVATLWEFYRLAEKSGHPVSKTIGMAGGAAALLAGVAAYAGQIVIRASSASFLIFRGTPLGEAACGRCSISLVILFVGLTAVAPLLARVPPTLALAGASSTLFGVALIALPAISFCYLRSFSPRAVLFLLGLVWICDSCAYYGGKRWGTHKLAPVISPKKTWEGSISGLVGATVFGAAAGTWWLLPELGPVRAGVAAMLASTAGQIGDLVESMWKRGAGAKDSGTFLPGHGGFYDRIDSLLFAGPVVAAFVAGAR
jgi:phosphatidate cytidylyltransferase